MPCGSASSAQAARASFSMATVEFCRPASRKRAQINIHTGVAGVTSAGTAIRRADSITWEASSRLITGNGAAHPHVQASTRCGE